MTLLDRLQGPDALAVVFQPIYELREPRLRLLGLEALVRGAEGSGLESAEELFDRSRRERVEAAVDRICLEAIFASLEGISPSLDFSVNVHASTLGGDRDFPAFFLGLAEAHAVEPTRVTMEIVEQTRPGDPAVLRDALRSLRRAGASIALDDIGLGYSNFRMILDCAPDFLKIDRYLVTGCDKDLRRRAILDSVFLLGARLGARVIAEGVESLRELELLTSLGMELFQGFLLGRPIPARDLKLGSDALALPGAIPLFLRERSRGPTAPGS